MVKKIEIRKVTKLHHNFSFSKLGFNPQSEFYLIISRLCTDENILFTVLFSHFLSKSIVPLPMGRFIFCCHHYIFKINVA